MTAFMFQPRVGDSDKVSAALGVSSAAKYSDSDLNKVVKLAGAHNYVPVSATDQIEGVVIAIAPNTVNNGFSFGTVQTDGRIVATNASATALAVGDYVVAAAQLALGTVQPYPLVQKSAANAEFFKWRVVDLLTAGTGAQNTQVLIERI